MRRTGSGQFAGSDMPSPDPSLTCWILGIRRDVVAQMPADWQHRFMRCIDELSESDGVIPLRAP